MKSALLFLFFCLGVLNSYSQSNFIKGKVVQGETELVVINASVFITNTSRGTVTNEQGDFLLPDVPVGTYDLVISCVGYETLVYTYKPGQLPLNLRVALIPKPTELAAVTVEPAEKDGWKKWGKFFTDNFVGTGSYSKECIIANKEALRFRYSRKRNLLTVTAAEPLQIKNKMLGYNIQYQLESFNFDFKKGYLSFLGYSLFQELKQGGAKRRQLKNRQLSYNGSMIHFMKSLYANKLLQEGFEVKRLIKTPNREKERIKKMLKENAVLSSSTKSWKTGIPIDINVKKNEEKGDADSSGYYNRILRQPDEIETYGNYFLSADSLVTVIDGITRQFAFDDYLYVMFKKEKEDPAYLQHTNELNRSPYFQRSMLYLTNKTGVSIDEKGNYYMPLDIISYGYWGWSEKISGMLPLDYETR
jgi:CarboxypepD_reg-like domain